MTDSLAHSAARGAFFTLGAQGAKILLQLASVVILARLLSPHDYGLIALVMVVVGAGEVFRDFGLTAASIQAPHLSAGQRTNLFWINAGIGVLLCLLVFGISWPVSEITQQTDVLPLLQTLSSLFVLNGLATQHRAGLLRALRFRAIASVDISAAAIGLAIAVIAALSGLGVWALALQQLAAALTTCVGVFALGRWLPGHPSRKDSVSGIVTFGWNLVATNMIVYLGSQVDTILVGTRFGTTSLGLYNRAYQLIMTPLGQIRSPVTGVAQPVFARVQQDAQRFRKYVIGGQLALGYGLGLPLALVTALATPVVEVMLGPRWSEATPILQCFAVAAFLTNLAFVGYWVYVSRGFGKQLFRYTMVTLAIKVTCLLAGSSFGLLGLAIGFAVAPALEWPLSIWWLSRLTPMPRKALYLGAGRAILLGIMMGVSAWAAATSFQGTFAAPGQIAIGVGAGCLAMSSSLLLRAYREDAKMLVWFGRLMLKRKASPAAP